MTSPLVPPDRGYTNPQRLLPDGGSLEEMRRAFNRVYDQIDRINQATDGISQTVTPVINPTTPGGQVVLLPGTPNGSNPSTPTIPTNPTTPVTPPIPVTFYVPTNTSGVLSIDSDGYVGMSSVTI